MVFIRDPCKGSLLASWLERLLLNLSIRSCLDQSYAICKHCFNYIYGKFLQAPTSKENFDRSVCTLLLKKFISWFWLIFWQIEFFWFCLEESLEKDAVQKALMSLLRQDVKGIVDWFGSMATSINLIPLKLI